MRRILGRVALIAALFILNACANLQEIDRSYVNQPEADLRNRIFSTSSPLSGLRASAGAGGSNSCSTCAK